MFPEPSIGYPRQKKVRLLKDLLMTHGDRRHYMRGEFLFRKGDDARVVLISKGTLAVAGPTLNHMKILSGQDVLGLYETIAQNPSKKTAVAVGPLMAYTLSAKDFNMLLLTKPAIRQALLQGILRGESWLD